MGTRHHHRRISRPPGKDDEVSNLETLQQAQSISASCKKHDLFDVSITIVHLTHAFCIPVLHIESGSILADFWL